MKKILKFYSPTCGPCKLMSKKLEEIKDIEIVDIDVTNDDNESIVDTEYKIRTIPTIIVEDTEDPTFFKEFKGIVPIEKIKEVCY